jgi:class 3 adenylate cyclase/TolB-like protein
MTRRLTTILAADIAGFSRLVGADEEGVLAEQRAHRREFIDPLLEKFGGRVANTAGDSLLIEFPSAVEAVRCAIAFQEGMASRTMKTPEDRRIAFRIGINVGDVVSEGSDLLGDGVNVAARLEALAPSGGIILSRSARDQVRDRLDLNLADLGEIEVKNIVRPVRAFQVLKAGEAAIGVATTRPRRRSVWAAAAAVLLAVVIGGVYWQSQGGIATPPDPDATALPLPDEPSILVLPFDNLSGDTGQDYFVEGFTTAIRTHLAKFPQLFVISGATAMSVPDKPVKELGRELGVGYVLNGSLQRGGETLTVNAELIEAERARTIWAEQYEFPVDDPFAVQARLIQEIVGTLRVVIEDEAIAALRRQPTENPRAYDYYLRAIAAQNALSREGRLESIRLLNRAVDLDPDFLSAHFELSGLHLALWRFGGADDPEEALRLARYHAERALALDQADYRGHYRLGMLHLFADHDHELAYVAFQRALDDNPNDADILYAIGFLRSLMGEGAEAIEWNNKAKRVNPHYPGWYNFNAALSHFLIKDYDQALLLAKTGIAAYPKSLAPRRILIATLVEMGRMEEARSIRPDFRLSTFRNTPFQHARDQDRYFNAMRQAGIPD